MDFKNYNIDTSEEKIIEALQKIPDNIHDRQFKPAAISYLTCLLSSKHQKKILDSNKKLVYGTWVLAITTAILAVITWCTKS